MRIVFCGTGEIGAPALQALLTSEKHTVVGVITQPDKPAGRDLKPRMSAIKQIALAQNLPVQQPEKLRSATALEDLRALAPDLMVVAAYGQILPKSVLETPRLGCLNLHASLLPRHRGASPIHAAILAGDQETGITVMYMDEGLDTGDILLAQKLAIGSDETTGQLHDRLADLASPCLLEALDLLEQGNAPRFSQDSALATYAPKLTREHGAIGLIVVALGLPGLMLCGLLFARLIQTSRGPLATAVVAVAMKPRGGMRESEKIVSFDDR